MEKHEYDEIILDTFNKIKSENQELKKVNILISGKSGVGKSTLINSIFGDNLTETGIGLPKTKEIKLISNNRIPVNIYDTVGLEMQSVKKDIHSLTKLISKNDIKKLINNTQKTKTIDDDIHVVWYAISGNSARIEEPEIDLINWVIKHEIPIIIVLTKSFDAIESRKLKKELLKLVPDVSGVIITLAKNSDNKSSFGVENLIKRTFEVLPDGISNSFLHSQLGSISLKRSESLKVVGATMAANFSVGFSPIPGSDAPLMISSQISMIAKITSIFGVDIKKNQIETVVSSLFGVYGALIVGKSLSGNIAKLLPGLGTVGGGLVSGGVGMVITGALGRAYIKLMELVLTGKVDLSSSNSDEITTLLVSLLPEYLPKNSMK